MKYEPTFESLHQHAVPEWFHDAKLGIFVHWGAYSVPGWALRSERLAASTEAAAKGWEYAFAHNPYAEWYLNTLSIDGSPTQRVPPRDVRRGLLLRRLRARCSTPACAAGIPQSWAALFAAAGARYVVPGTKHHDGFLMWPSAHPNPFKQGWHAERDLIGELATAVRAQGHALRALLLRRPRLDVPGAADPQHPGDVRRHPADARTTRATSTRTGAS